MSTEGAHATGRRQPGGRGRTAVTARLESVAPVIPVRDLDAALRHYERLGFEVRHYSGGGYGYAMRDGVHIHLAYAERHDPKTTASVVYLFVDDADALHAEWEAARVPGRLREPFDAQWGMREGGHVDPDGNLIRFGHRLR